uniref:Ninjurin 1 n=1 Tax=Oryzias melastigma TaxID=30732 RepID=A0A3B3DGG4_ORYME
MVVGENSSQSAASEILRPACLAPTTMPHSGRFSRLLLTSDLFSQARSLRRMDYNMYATKKSAAQSMLDVALLMANSSQLKTLLYVGPQYRFYIPLIVLLALSMTLQVVVGLLLVFIAKYNLNDERKHPKLERMNNAATVFVFFTVLINIFITALGFQGTHMSDTRGLESFT